MKNIEFTKPLVEIIEIENEEVIATSGSVNYSNNGQNIPGL